MELDDKKQLILFNLQREDSLNNNRLGWLLSFQGFIFATYGVLLSEWQPLNLTFNYLNLGKILICI